MRTGKSVDRWEHEEKREGKKKREEGGEKSGRGEGVSAQRPGKGVFLFSFFLSLSLI